MAADSANDGLWVNGVGRDDEYSKCLVVYLNRKATDDEMRRFHDAIRDVFKDAPGVKEKDRGESD